MTLWLSPLLQPEPCGTRPAPVRLTRRGRVYWRLAQHAAQWSPTAHTGRVALLAVAVAWQLGLSPAQVREVCLAGLLHDLGKLLIPTRVRRKAGPLSGQDWRQMQRHPVYSACLTGLLPGASRTVRAAVRHHHERLDGAGYPDRLSGEAVPLLARVLAVCDVYDALISPRSYKPAWPAQAVVRELRDQAGPHFDPQVVAALGAVLGWPPTPAVPA